MDKQDSIQRRRSEILTELAGLDRMRRGSVTEQFVEAAGRDGRHRRRGPYPLYTFKAGGKTVSRRIRGEDVGKYREQVQAVRLVQGVHETTRWMVGHVGGLRAGRVVEAARDTRSRVEDDGVYYCEVTDAHETVQSSPPTRLQAGPPLV